MIEKTQAKPWEQRGWLISYLAEGDCIFGSGRMAYWFDAASEGKLSEPAYTFDNHGQGSLFTMRAK